MRKTVGLVLLLAAVVASASLAETISQTITVFNDPNLPGYPPNAGDYGWITAKGRLSSSGGWTWLNAPSPTAVVWSQLAEGGSPSPPGAIYFKHGTSYQNIDQSWIGTDNYVGVKASDITRLSYYTYTTLKGWQTNNCNQGDWGWNVRQPVQLQISFKKSPTSDEYVHLMFRPWGLKGEKRSFYDYEVWEYWDCLAPTAVWWDGLPENGGSEPGSYGNWDYFFNPVTGKYPDAVIAAPCDTEYYGKWGENQCVGDMYRTGSGKSLNLVVGARAFSVWYPGDTESTAWWQESDYFEGYADNLTIGVKDSQGNITETTWNFEQYDPAYYTWIGGTYGIDNKDRTNAAVIGNARYRQYFVMWGKVVDASGAPNKFTIDDGSGNPVIVIASGGDGFVSPDDYVRVEGAVSKRRAPCPQYQIGYYFTAKPEGVRILKYSWEP